MTDKSKPAKGKASAKFHIVVALVSLLFIYISVSSILNPAGDKVNTSDVFVLTLWSVVLGASIAYIAVLRKLK